MRQAALLVGQRRVYAPAINNVPSRIAMKRVRFLPAKKRSRSSGTFLAIFLLTEERGGDVVFLSGIALLCFVLVLMCSCVCCYYSTVKSQDRPKNASRVENDVTIRDSYYKYPVQYVNYRYYVTCLAGRVGETREGSCGRVAFWRG